MLVAVTGNLPNRGECRRERRENGIQKFLLKMNISKNATHGRKTLTKLTKINNEHENSFKEKVILHNSSTKILNKLKMDKEVKKQ